MAASTCPPAEDNEFGPWAGPDCRGGFDFTLRFEEGILALPLLCIFLAVLPLRILTVARRRQKVRTSVLLWLKVIAALCHAALQLAVLIIWCRNESVINRAGTSIPTCAVAFAASLGLIPLLVYEHYRSLRPSFTAEAFLLLSLLFETCRARTLWLLDESQTLAAVFTSTVALKAVLLALEATEKRSLLLPEYQGSSTEATSGTISRAFLFWLHPILWAGYHRTLNLRDLFILDNGLEVEPLHEKFRAAWEAVPDQKLKGALLSTWFTVLAPSLVAPAFPRLCLTGFTFAQPFLVYEAVTLAASPGGQPYNNYGYGLIVAFIFVYFGLAFGTVKYEYLSYRAAVVSRASLIPCLFDKTLRLDIMDVDSKAALTLFSTDMETVTRGVVQLQETWASLLELGIAMWLLERQVGVSTVIPISVVFATMIFGGAVAVPAGQGQAAWNKASQKRVSVTSYILRRVKWIKISGLTDFAFKRIEDLRLRELQISERYRSLLTWVLLSSSIAPLLIPFLTYVTYASLAERNGGTLDLTRAFTSFSLFILLIKPLSTVVIALPSFAGAMASIGRVQEYLNRQEKGMKTLQEPPGDDSSSATGEVIEKHQSSIRAESSSGEKQIDPLISPVIVSVKGRLTWPEAETPVLDLEQIDIPRDSFTMVLGPIASGKSTLLSLMMGEMSQLLEGELEINYSGAAYCSQQPFIPNRTCREVILGNAPYDAAWYSQVIKACALEADYQQWSQGDESLAGSAATSLSGGQKQRLSLARAVYSGKELVIMDDSFTGLDAKTENQVFESLLGPRGLLRSHGRTALLGTSSTRHASHAERILLLGPNGTLLDQGNFADVCSRSAVQSLPALLEPEASAIRAGNYASNTVAEVTPLQDAKVYGVVMQTKEEEVKLNRPAGDHTIYWYYLESAGRVNLIIFAICLIGLAFFDTFPSVWLQWWAEANETQPNEHLNKWLGGYAGFTIGGIVSVVFGSRQLFIKIISTTGIELHKRLVQTVSRATMGFFSSVDTGVTINRFSQDLQLVDMQLPIAAFGTVVALAYAIGQTIIMSVASKYVIIVVVGLVAVLCLLQHFYLRTSPQVRYLDIELKAPLYSQLIETSEGLSTIRAFGWESEAKTEHLRILKDSQRAIYTLYCLQRWLILTVDIVIAILAVALAAVAIGLRGQNGAGSVGLALVNLLGLVASVRTILLTWVVMEITIGAVARIKTFVRNLKIEGDGDELSQAPVDWPSRGDVEINNVSASYNSSTPVLRGISLSIKHGQKIAICGRTGSGKSSIVMTLLRMLDVDEGAVVVDGLDISRIEHETVRSKIVALPQEPLILDGTVRQNLDPLGACSDEEVASALQESCLEDVIKKIGGLDAEISETSFSHGQRQLFIFCRAKLRRGKIIIMDEPTSGLDSDATDIVEGLISSWADATLIIVVHKLDAIDQYDRVAVLEEGQLVAFDSPQNLKQNNGTLFNGLFGAWNQASRGASSI